MGIAELSAHNRATPICGVSSLDTSASLPPELGPFFASRRDKREPSVVVATELAMLLFCLPLIIFEAMLTSPERKASKPASDKAFEPDAG